MAYKRDIFQKVIDRLLEPNIPIQVLAGPRQVGKTTLIKQVTQEIKYPFHYASADQPGLSDHVWIAQQWQQARHISQQQNKTCVLILDEIQKLPQWSDSVKQFWDEDQFNETQIKLVILGSSQLLIQKGLSESLAGRFELIPVTHWSFEEMQTAFNYNLEQYIYFGGYPGAANFIDDERRWRDYMLNSLVETTISRDILLMARINKPALLRQLFVLGCQYSGQILSLQKILGQLQDAGNASTLADYLKLLEQAGMLKGISKYYGKKIKQKASSPKLQVFNNALISSQSSKSLNSSHDEPSWWGRLVESAIGAHLLNQSIKQGFELYYWRDRNLEVDFVIQYQDRLWAIEVKSSIEKHSNGLHKFMQAYPNATPLLVGGSGIPIQEFLTDYHFE